MCALLFVPFGRWLSPSTNFRLCTAKRANHLRAQAPQVLYANFCVLRSLSSLPLLDVAPLFDFGLFFRGVLPDLLHAAACYCAAHVITFVYLIFIALFLSHQRVRYLPRARQTQAQMA